MTLKDFCHSNIVSIFSSASLKDAAILMEARYVGCLLVTDGENGPLGVITDRDIVVKAVAEGFDVNTVTVAQIMSSGVIAADINQSIEVGIQLMQQHSIRRIFITDRVATDIRGVVSTDDLVRIYGRDMNSLSTLFASQDGTASRHRAHEFTRMC